jgi:hypothetical protein
VLNLVGVMNTEAHRHGEKNTHVIKMRFVLTL